ncbi:MAG: PAS domain S-box protein [Anaerolineae bacterium]|nr:PAS domain S-box protein [Anaerolineae bacterium]
MTVVPMPMQYEKVLARLDTHLRLRDVTSQLRTLINAMPDIVIFKDGQGRYLEANEFGLQFFGLEGVDYRGKTDGDLAAFTPFYYDALQVCEETDEAAWQAQTVSRSDEVIPRPDGSNRTFDVIKVPTFHPDGSRKGLLVVGRDVTERKQAEEALRKAHAELEQRVEERTAELRQANEQLAQKVQEHKRAEEALRQSEERYRGLIEMSPDAVLVHDGEKLLFVNPAAAKIIGVYEPGEAVGMAVLDIVHPDWQSIVATRVNETLQEQRLAPLIEEKYRRLDGIDIDVEVAAMPVMWQGAPAIQVAARDITERKRAEEEVKNAHRRLDSTLKFITTVISAIPIPLFYKDREGRYLGVNEAFADLLGFTPDYYAGKTVMELWPSEFAQVYHKQDLELMRNPQKQVYEFSVLDKNRVVRPAIWCKYVFRDEDGQIAGIVGAFQDITERKRAEEEKEKLQAQMVQAQKMEALGQLAGGIAHDFNNLLTVIRLNTQLMTCQLLDQDPLWEHVREIAETSERATKLTRQLLSFGRREVIEPQLLCLNDTIRDLIPMLHRIMGEGIELRTALAPDLWTMKADPSQMERVMVNLVVNARDAMLGGGTLTVATDNVVLDEKYTASHLEAQPGEHVRLTVCDTGVGMSAAVKTRIFEPFFTTKGHGYGTGLGLAIVFGIVKQNDGHIQVRSQVGHGTTFEIYLPMKRRDG